jgi:hypothetical protein
MTGNIYPIGYTDGGKLAMPFERDTETLARARGKDDYPLIFQRTLLFAGKPSRLKERFTRSAALRYLGSPRARLCRPTAGFFPQASSAICCGIANALGPGEVGVLAGKLLDCAAIGGGAIGIIAPP